MLLGCSFVILQYISFVNGWRTASSTLLKFFEMLTPIYICIYYTSPPIPYCVFVCVCVGGGVVDKVIYRNYEIYGKEFNSNLGCMCNTFKCV